MKVSQESYFADISALSFCLEIILNLVAVTNLVAITMQHVEPFAALIRFLWSLGVVFASC